MPDFCGIVFEVQRIHRNPDPPAGWMMVFRPGAGVKDGRVEYINTPVRNDKLPYDVIIVTYINR